MSSGFHLHRPPSFVKLKACKQKDVYEVWATAQSDLTDKEANYLSSEVLLILTGMID